MARERNKHGLGDIPDGVKRQVRQYCGFGCVICGAAVCHYEHVDPEFKDAMTHDPDKIVMLCGSHHDMVTRGQLSKDTVKKYAKDPACKKRGFSRGAFDVGNTFPIIEIGPVTALRCKSIIRVSGHDVFSVKEPEQEGTPFRINAQFYDDLGNLLLQIIDNEWRVGIENWDVEVIGQEISVRKRKGEISLCLWTEPPHKLVVKRLNTRLLGYELKCENGMFEVRTPTGVLLSTTGASFESCDTAISVSENQILVGVGGNIRIESMSMS